MKTGHLQTRLPAPRVEPVHAGAWPAGRPRPLAEALQEQNEIRRGIDRVDFSDELRRLNTEGRTRDLACTRDCDEPRSIDQHEADRDRPALRLAPETREITVHVTELRETYEVTRRSATGRLIDMLM